MATAKKTTSSASARKKPQPSQAAAAKPAAKKAAAPAKAAAPKAAAAAKKPAAAARKPNAAFMKAMTPSATLAAVVGANPLPRTEVTKKVWDYIKKQQAAGRSQPPHDQRRRQAESCLWRQGAGVDVRNDQADFGSPEIRRSGWLSYRLRTKSPGEPGLFACGVGWTGFPSTRSNRG